MNTGLIAIAVAAVVLGEEALGVYLLMHEHAGWAAFLMICGAATPAGRLIHGRDVCASQP